MNRPPLFDRLPEQYFAKILAASAAAAAAPGEPFIDLGRGNPDLPPPEHALQALRDATYHGYPPFRGLPDLKDAIAHRYREDHGVELAHDEIAVIPGTKTGITLVTVAAAGPGETVLLPDPGYPDYPSGVAFAGARAAPLPLDPEHFQPEWADAPPAALAILNYPSNPCAVAERPGTFETAVDWAGEHGAWLMHDLAYGFLSFEHRARSILEVPGAREVAVELWSPSKIYGMAGWRIGFVVGNRELVGRVETIMDHAAAGVFTGLQAGLIAALRSDQGDVAERAAIYRARRDRLVAAIPGIRVPEGTFYAWWNLPDGLTPERLIEEARVGVAPGIGFGERGRGWARLSLALADDLVDEAAARIATCLR